MGLWKVLRTLTLLLGLSLKRSKGERGQGEGSQKPRNFHYT